jgi:hypothetical protein
MASSAIKLNSRLLIAETFAKLKPIGQNGFVTIPLHPDTTLNARIHTNYEAASRQARQGFEQRRWRTSLRSEATARQVEDGAESPSAASLGSTPFSILNHPFSLERTRRSWRLGG